MLRGDNHHTFIGRIAHPTGEVGDGDILARGDDLEHLQLVPG